MGSRSIASIPARPAPSARRAWLPPAPRSWAYPRKRRSARTSLRIRRGAMPSAAWWTLRRSRSSRSSWPRKRPGRAPASWWRQPGGRADGILLSGDSAEPVLPAGPAPLRAFVSALAMIPAQPTRDLLNREAAHEHVAQLVQLPIRPFPADVLGRLDFSHGSLRIQERGTDHAQQRFVLGILRAA